MILKFGTYSHADGECKLSIQKDTVRAQSGIPVSTVVRWEIEGLLIPTAGASDTVADLTTKILALEAAYKQIGVDALLLTAGGSATAHALRSAGSVGGVQVVKPPSFPSGEQAEYATYRRYTVGLEAEYLIGDGTGGGNGSEGADVMNWQETITISGGLPLYAWTRPIFGIPERQIARQHTTYTATQSGSAVGYSRLPDPPLPLWPAALVSRSVGNSSPQAKGSGYVEYPISWTYQFESAEKLIGVATRQKI